jgi:hypothetical protein
MEVTGSFAPLSYGVRVSHPSAPEGADLAWLAALAESLRNPPAPRTAELALLDALEEIEQWRRHARPDTWRQGKKARGALCAEFAASSARLERHLRRALSPWLAQYARVVHGRFTEGKIGAFDVAAMDAPAAGLRAALVSARGIGAAWQDAVEASQSGHDEPLAWSLTNLTSQLAASGRGSNFTLLGAASALHPGRWAQPEHPGVAGQPTVVRLVAAHEILTGTPTKHHCVAWITYARARLMGSEETLGPVTFFDADWALPNALADDGQPFPHRDELRRLAQGHSSGWQFDDVNWVPDRSRRPYLGLARVDLGQRETNLALEDAERIVQVLLSTVALRSGGVVWQRSGPAHLLVDGQVAETRYAADRVQPAGEVDHYGQRLMATGINRHGPDLATLLSAPLPADLAEALRMLGEAAAVDSRESRESRLEGRRVIDQRTALALQDAAHSHLATHARMSPEDLERHVLGDWPYATWVQEVMRAVAACLGGGGIEGDELERAVRAGGESGLTYSFVEAAHRREDLLARCDGATTRRSAARWLDSISDARLYLELERELIRSRDLLTARALRVRNGIMHGTPSPTPVLESVLDLSRFRAFEAFWSALEAIAAGRTMRAELETDATVRAARDRRLHAGISLLTQWQDDLDVVT